MRSFAAAVALWLSVQYWVLGPHSAVVIHDNADCTLPHWLALAGAGSGAAARWMPWSMGGFDRLANDLPLDQPLLWPFFVLPGWLAWGALMFLHPFLAAWGMRRLCVESLETSEEAGRLAAAAFATALARAFIFKNAWGYALVPAALWALDRAARDRASGPARAAALCAAAGAAFGLLSSGPLTLPFTLASVPVWLWLQGERGGRGAACAASFVVAAVAVRLPVFLAMWAEAPFSHRAGAAAVRPGPLSLLASSVSDAAAEHAPALAVAAAGAWAARGRAGRLASFAAVAAAFLLSPVAVGAAVALAGDRLGAARGFSFDRFASLFPLWAAACAALGFDLLPAPRRKPVLAAAAAAMLAWSLGPKFADAKGWYFEGSYSALFAAPSVRAVASAAAEGPFRVATVPHGLHPAYANAYGLESADGYANLYPARYRRFWNEVVAPTLGADPAFRRDLLGWGNRVYLYLRAAPEPGRALEAAGRWRLDLLALAGTRFLFSRLPLAGPGLRLARGGTRPEDGGFRERLARRLRRDLGGDDGLFVYEVPGWMPRAFVVPRAVPAASTDEAFALLRAADARAFRERVAVEGLEAAPAPGKGYSVPRIVARTPDRLELEVSGSAPGVLVVTDSWSPRRTAAVDGRPVPVLPAWGAFQAVLLPSGARRVAVAYGPPVSRGSGAGAPGPRPAGPSSSRP